MQAALQAVDGRWGVLLTVGGEGAASVMEVPQGTYRILSESLELVSTVDGKDRATLDSSTIEHRADRQVEVGPAGLTLVRGGDVRPAVEAFVWPDFDQVTIGDAVLSAEDGVRYCGGIRPGSITAALVAADRNLVELPAMDYDGNGLVGGACPVPQMMRRPDTRLRLTLATGILGDIPWESTLGEVKASPVMPSTWRRVLRDARLVAKPELQQALHREAYRQHPGNVRIALGFAAWLMGAPSPEKADPLRAFRLAEEVWDGQRPLVERDSRCLYQLAKIAFATGHPGRGELYVAIGSRLYPEDGFQALSGTVEPVPVP